MKKSEQPSIGPVRRALWGIPLGWQLSILYTLLLVLTLALVGVLVYTQQQDFLIKDTADRLVQSATRAETDTQTDGPARGQDRGPGDHGGPPGESGVHLDDLVRGLSGTDVTVALLDSQGQVITSTLGLGNSTAPVVDPVTSRQAAEVLSGGGPVHWIAQRADGTRRVVVLTQITGVWSPGQGLDSNSPQTWVLEQSASLAAADAALARLATYLLLGVLGGTLAGIIFGIAFTRSILSPLDHMVGAAEAIAEGDLQRRLQLPPGRNEVARLGTAFDNMVGRLVAALEAQRRFVADASHELRTPLTSLKGLTEILMIGAHGNDPRVVEQSAQAINSELERLIRLVTDLLTLSRIESTGGAGVPPPRRVRMDVCATVDAAATQIGVLAEGRGVRLIHNCSEPVWVNGDSGQLKQVLLNLLDNALRYTPAGGEITLSAARQGQTARIDVKDTGTGIEADKLPQIFERFYRGDTSRARATGNTGLGLSIVKTIIAAHGGKIDVQSMPGEGTLFTISLPVAESQTPIKDEGVPGG